MRQVTEDDAYVGLIHAMILQATTDYELLRRHGAISSKGSVQGHKFGRRLSKTSYHHYDGIVREYEASELVRFLRGKALEFLCDTIGHQACRIRRKLGLRKEAE